MPRLILTVAAALIAATAAAADRPNVVLILADDLGYGDLGCYGQKRIKTPNLDQLAAAGTRFTQAYAGSTVCGPSRCCLMTGYHTGNARVRGNAAPKVMALRPDDVTVAKLLQVAGYRTAVIGKWGLGQTDLGGESGVPSRQGFDESFGFLNHGHAHNYYPSHLYRNEQRVPLPNTVPDETKVGAGVSTNKAVYAPDLFIDEAVTFVTANKDRPFFLYFAPTAPHANNEAKDKGMEVPDLGEYANLDIPAAAKGHAAMITRLDRDIGRLLDTLAKLGLTQTTYVIFTSDNGPHKEGGYHFDMNDSNGPLRGGKRDLYEGGIRVPFIVRGPEVAAGKVSESVIAFWDVLPTVGQWTGVKRPAAVDGRSFVAAARGEHRSHEPLYWEFHEGGFAQAVRFGDWKAVRKPKAATELYDLGNDLAETKNVATDKPDMVAKAERLMAEMRTESADWPIKK